uniref:Vacuolar protein-sorting-associated protein 25 n=1 Tax=Micromonas pusilla TaxID=38833 RepID=A0A7R9TKY5_MICPS
MTSSDFAFPDFFDYPPYFTVQPTPETFRKQCELWKSLVLRYCAHHALFVLNLDDVSLPLFDNPNVKRRLTLDARRTFVDALVADGNATWLDDDGGDDGKHRALILWRSVPEWGERLMQWARDGGREGAVVTIDEIREKGGGMPELADAKDGSGVEEIILRAARNLQLAGKAAVIEGTAGDDTGVKFF